MREVLAGCDGKETIVLLVVVEELLKAAYKPWIQGKVVVEPLQSPDELAQLGIWTSVVRFD